MQDTIAPNVFKHRAKTFFSLGSVVIFSVRLLEHLLRYVRSQSRINTLILKLRGFFYFSCTENLYLLHFFPIFCLLIRANRQPHSQDLFGKKVLGTRLANRAIVFTQLIRPSLTATRPRFPRDKTTCSYATVLYTWQNIQNIIIIWILQSRDRNVNV